MNLKMRLKRHFNASVTHAPTKCKILAMQTKTRKIALAADHAGYFMKELVKTYLRKQGYEFEDFGTDSDSDADYPDYVHKLGFAIDRGDCQLGFVFCGSGNGVNITANKHTGIRSALCWQAEIATMARAHNDANVCAVPARYISANEILAIAKTFLETSFEGGRHEKRVCKIALP